MVSWFVAVAWAATPLQVQLTEKEEASLAAGEVVVRSPTDTGLVVGAVHIPATREQVMKAVMDFDAREESVGAIDAIEVYAPATDPAGLGAKFTLSVLGTEIIYYLRYDLDPAGVNFALDKTRENGITDSTGGYWTYPVDDGIRLVYWSRTDTGRWVPGFVRNSLSVKSFRDQLAAMRTLAPKK